MEGKEEEKKKEKKRKRKRSREKGREKKRRERKGCLSKDSQTCTLLVNVLSFIDQKDDEKEFFRQIFYPFHNQLMKRKKEEIKKGKYGEKRRRMTTIVTGTSSVPGVSNRDNQLSIKMFIN